MTTVTVSIERRFRDVSEWLTRLDASYSRAKAAAWEFLFDLRDGVDQFGRTDHGKAELYELAANQLGVSRKTLQNYVSAARSQKAQVAHELGLEYGHVAAVLGMTDEDAADVLYAAAEQNWAPPQVIREVWERKTAHNDLEGSVNPKTKKFTVRSCVVCGFKFSDAHHLYPRNRGGTKILSLCPNHHRNANMLQVMIGDGGDKIEFAEKFAREHFDEQFNEKLLDYLVGIYAYGLVVEDGLFFPFAGEL